MAHGFTHEISVVSGNLDDLDDVIITAPADDSVLAYDTGTSKWIDQTAADAGLTPSTHVGSGGAAHADAGVAAGFMTAAMVTKLAGIEAAATADQTAAEILAALLTVDGTGSLLDADFLDGNSAAAFAVAAHNHTVDSLSNVVITGVADNEVLTWDTATSKWTNQAVTPGGSVALDDLTDVIITAPADHSVLAYDTGTSKWIDMTAADAALAPAAHVGAGGAEHALATTDTAGFMSDTQFDKLAGIETAATADMTAAEILAALLTVDGTGCLLDADLLDGLSSADFAPIAHVGGTGAAHGNATGAVAGFLTAADFTKLAGIEASATADQTAAEILAALLTVDSSGSLLDADKLDTLEGAAYTLVDGTRPFTAKQGFVYGSAAVPSIYWSSDVDTGFYGADGSLYFSAAGVLRAWILATQAGFAVPLFLTYGSAAAPALAWNSDQDTGLWGADGKVQVTTAGTTRLTVDATDITSTLPWSGPVGTAALPAIRGTDGNTGMYFGADLVYLSTGGTLRLTLSTTGLTSTLPLLLADGTAAAPTLAASGDTHTGIFYAADVVGISTAGTERFRFATAGHTSTVPILLANGTAAAPTLAASGDTHTGIAFAADDIIFSTGGTQRADLSTTFLTTTLPHKLPDGTAGAPALLPTSDVDTGLFFAAAKVGVSTSGTERVGIADAGVTLSGPILLPYGAVGTPSLRWASDADSGLWGVDGHVSVSIAGTERAHVDANGLNVIGTVYDDGVALSQTGHAHYQMTQFCQSGTLAVTTDTTAFRLQLPYAITIAGVCATVSTAPTGAAIIVDVHKSGTTIFSTQANRPEIAASGFTSGWETPDVTAAAADTYLTVNVDQIGSTIAGANLTVIIKFTAVA